VISTDAPIKKKGKEDLLKRAPLAEKVGLLIKNYKGKESIVIGIEGIWGAGKTSFINLILESIKGRSPVVIKFNPWSFASSNELIDDFFSSLVACLRESDIDRKIYKEISKYAQKLFRQTEIDFDPTISTIFGNIHLGRIAKIGGKPAISEMRGSIDSLLSKLNKKILIVIDDIDRLDKQETLLVLKMVKMTANFPNTVFLLAYDREKVAERISEIGISGEDYLKKIVQVSFTLPIPDKQNLRNILFKGLNETLDTVYGNYVFNKDEQRHWEAVFHGGLGNLFITIRDINRYLSSLRLNWSVINKEDVNPVDFIAIESLRIFTPTLYNMIAENKLLFLNRDSSSINFNTRDGNEERKKLYEELLKDERIVPKSIKKQVDGICRELFPQLDIRSSHGSDSERDWRREKRICAEQKFGFYFQLSVPENEVSEIEILALLSLTKKKASLKKHLLYLDKENKLTKAIELLIDRVEDITESDAKILIKCLWIIDGQVKDKKTGLFELNDFSTLVSRLGYQFLKHSVPENHRQDFILELLKKTRNLTFATRLFAVFEEQVEKGDADLFVDKSFVSTFKDEIVKVILIKAKNNTLSSETRLDVILFRWLKWDKKIVVEKYVGKLIKGDQGLIRFISGFTGLVHSSSEGTYKTISKDAMGKLYPIKKIEERVKQFKKTKGIRMSKSDKEIIGLFDNPPKTW